MKATNKQSARNKGRSLLAMALAQREQLDESSRKVFMSFGSRSDDDSYAHDQVGCYRRAINNRGDAYGRAW